MKKVLMLILIFTMLFTINVFASDLPETVLNKISEIKSLYSNVSYVVTDTGEYYYIYFVQRKEDSGKFWFRDDTSQLGYFNGPGTDYDLKYDRCLKQYDSWNGISDFRQSSSKYSPTTSVIYSTVDCLDYNDYSTGRVFFSPPIPIMAKITQAVGMKSLEEMIRLSPMIAVLLVGSVALWKGWSALKTTLSGV